MTVFLKCVEIKKKRKRRIKKQTYVP